MSGAPSPNDEQATRIFQFVLELAVELNLTPTRAASVLLAGIAGVLTALDPLGARALLLKLAAKAKVAQP